jgi:hypothetical protein
MTSPRQYTVHGPDSGGIYYLEVVGDLLTHCGSGGNMPPLEPHEAQELVSEYLMRFGDRSDFEPVVRMRAELDGEYRVGIGRVRFRAGRAVEGTFSDACTDAGYGGHGCGTGCLGPIDREAFSSALRAMLGRPVRVAHAEWRRAPSDPWAAQGFIAFDDGA